MQGAWQDPYAGLLYQPGYLRVRQLTGSSTPVAVVAKAASIAIAVCSEWKAIKLLKRIQKVGENRTKIQAIQKPVIVASSVPLIISSFVAIPRQVTPHLWLDIAKTKLPCVGWTKASRA